MFPSRSFLNIPGPLKQSFKAFIKASKHIFKTCGIHSTWQLMRAHRGKQFLLESFGLRMHMPAVEAELCLERALAEKLHLVLLIIRLVKNGTHKGLVKASAAPLPRFEPWWDLILKEPSPILLEKNIGHRKDAIERFGERGDQRDLKTSYFFLQ